MPLCPFSSAASYEIAARQIRVTGNAARQGRCTDVFASRANIYTGFSKTNCRIEDAAQKGLKRERERERGGVKGGVGDKPSE